MIKKDSLHLRKLGNAVEPDNPAFSTLYVDENGNLVIKELDNDAKKLVFVDEQQTIERKEFASDRASFEDAVQRLNAIGGGIIVLTGVIEIGTDSDLDVNLKNITVKANRTDATRIDFQQISGVDQKRLIVRGGGTFNGVRFRNLNNATHKSLIRYMFEDEDETLLKFEYCAFQNPQEISSSSEQGHIEIDIDPAYSENKAGYNVYFEQCDMFGPRNNGLTVYQRRGVFTYAVVSVTDFTRANKRIWRWRSATGSSNSNANLRSDSITIDTSPADNIFTGNYLNTIERRSRFILEQGFTFAESSDFDLDTIIVAGFTPREIYIENSSSILAMGPGEKCHITCISGTVSFVAAPGISLNGTGTVPSLEPYDRVTITKIAGHEFIITKTGNLKDYLELSGGTMSGDIDMGDNKLLSVDSIIFEPNAIPPEPYKFGYDSDQQLLKYYDEESNRILVGENLVTKIRNTEGSTITKGQVVYITGSTGDLAEVQLASASNSNITCCVGVVLSDSINNNASGKMLVSGRLSGVNTSAFSSGDKVYLDTTDGGLTTTMPSLPNKVIRIGTVIRSHSNNGVIQVAPKRLYDSEIEDARSAAKNPTIRSNATTATDLQNIDEILVMSSEDANTVTIPTGLDGWTICNVIQSGEGKTTVQGSSGVTVNGADGGAVEVAARYQGVAILRTGTDEYIISAGVSP